MIEFLLTFFAASLGGAVGSFLNVVVWRLPNGMSLIEPGSFCPKCKRPIRFYDNVPILGWLFLRGKCRDCREPISVRYPLIETICFLTAGFLFYAIVFAGWTPPESSLLYWDEIKNFWFSGEETANSFQFFAPNDFESLLPIGILLTVFWSAFFFLLLTVALIEWDSFDIPKSLYYFAIFFGLCASFVPVAVPSVGRLGLSGLNWGFFAAWATTYLFLPKKKSLCWGLFFILSAIFCGFDFKTPIGSSFELGIYLPIFLTGPVGRLAQKITGKQCFLATLLFLVVLDFLSKNFIP